MFARTRFRAGTPRTTVRRGLAVALLFAAAAAPTTNPSASTPNPTTSLTLGSTGASEAAVSGWYADLAKPDAAVRESARAALLKLTPRDLPELRRVVARSRPTPAQATALREIVRQVFLSGDRYEPAPEGRGFLGIMMDVRDATYRDLQVPDESGPPPRGVIVADRFPGFDSAGALQNGDIIRGLARPAETFDDEVALQECIAGLRPGTTVELEVLRRGSIITVPVKLDAKPAVFVEPNAVQEGLIFRAERQKKFDRYWDSRFAPLLNPSAAK